MSEEKNTEAEFVEVPMSQLSAEALQGVIEEFVTREGTDYGLQVFSFEEKIAQIKAQLQSKKLAIVFDLERQSCTLIPRDKLPH